MRNNAVKSNARRAMGFTIAEVLIALLISVILGALVANLGFSMTQTARQSALDRQAESIYESANRNLTSIAIAGDMDALREGGTAVWNVFDGLAAKGGKAVTDRDYEDADKLRDYGTAYKDIKAALQGSIDMQSSEGDDDSPIQPFSVESGESSAEDELVPDAAEVTGKWQVEAGDIAAEIARDDESSPSKLETSDFTIYRLSSSDLSEKSAKAANLLLESGVVSSDVLDDQWAVFYAVDNNYDYASVLEVWYTTDEYARQMKKDYREFNDIVDVDTGQEAATYDTENERKELRDYSTRKSETDGHIGYYGVGYDTVIGLPAFQLGDPSVAQCWLTVTNAEKLIAHLYCYVPEGGVGYYDTYGYTNFTYQLNIKGQSSGQERTLSVPTLRPYSKDPSVDNGTPAYPVKDGGVIKGYYYNFDNITLDSLIPGESFKSRYGDFLPGEDITLSLSVSCGADLDAMKETETLPEATKTVNSLFESVDRPDSEGGDAVNTVSVGYGRHLQNLDTTVSGFSGFGDSRKIDVKQVRDIYFNGKNNTGDYSGLGSAWEDDVEQWATTYGASKVKGTGETDQGTVADLGWPVMTLSPIINGNIRSYEGAEGGVVIEDLVIDNRNDTVALRNPADYEHQQSAGLFGRFDGERVSGITLVDPIINPIARDGVECENAGGLIGAAYSGNVSIDSCGLYMNALVPGSSDSDGEAVTANGVSWLRAKKCAGGLVGYANQNVSVSNSYAATVVQAYGAGVDADSYSYAGGLIGRADGSISMSGSYADCYVGAGYVGAGYVGGLVGTVDGSGSGSGSFSIPEDGKGCYSAGFVLGGSVKEAGKFVAKSDVVLSEAGLHDSYSVFNFTDPFGASEPASYYNNGVPGPSTATGDAAGNGYYLAEFGEDALSVWPYPTLDLPHYGDWSESQQALLLKVVNQEALTVEADFTDSGLSNEYQATISMYGLTSGKTHEWSGKVSDLDKKVINLDSLYTSNGAATDRFKSQFSSKGFLPGENVVLWLTVKDDDKVVYPDARKNEQYMGYVTNSLFAYGAYGESNMESEIVKDATADGLLAKAKENRDDVAISGPKSADKFKTYIAYGRHLQNLDHGEFGFMSFTSDGTLSSSSNSSNLNIDAKQLQNIDFGEGSLWRKRYGVRKLVSIWSSNPVNPRMPYTTIFDGYSTNETIETYDGSGFAIKDMDVKPNEVHRATMFYNGLFGMFAGNELKNIHLINATANVEYARVTGALVGIVRGLRKDAQADGKVKDLLIEECESYLDKDYSASSPLITALLYAGGLVGNGAYVENVPENNGEIKTYKRPLTIKRSFASSIVSALAKDGEFDEESLPKCGGLVGSMEYSESELNIDNSYAACYLGSAYYVGGIVGFAPDDTDIVNSYSSGFVSKYKIAAGLAPQKVSSVQNCYSALAYDDASNQKATVYGLVTDVEGATYVPDDDDSKSPVMANAFEGESTSSYYTFYDVHNDSVVWSDLNGSLFSYLQSDLLKGFDLDGYETGKGGTVYALSDDSPESYPYPTIEGLPYYGYCVENPAADLGDYDLKVRLQVPARDASGKIQTASGGSVEKYELGEVLYRSDNLTDFITLVNPYYLAYLYKASGSDIPSDLKTYAKNSLGEFKTVSEQPPTYPDPSKPEDASMIERLTVGVGSPISSTAIENDDGDLNAENGISQAMRTVIPDAADWNHDHSASRYFFIPADESELEFFVGSSSNDDRPYQQTYRGSSEETVFFAGYGSESTSATKAAQQKSTGFGESISKASFDKYIDDNDPDKNGAISVNGTSNTLTRGDMHTEGRKTVVRYSGEWTAYLEWFPKVTLKSVDQSYVSSPMGDFINDKKATDVEQYVTNREGEYLNTNGEVVESKEDAATKTASLHYANFGGETGAGSYFADASMSSASLVREQASSASVEAFLNRYKGFSYNDTSGGNKVLTGEDTTRWLLGFGFNMGDSYAQVYNNRGFVPRAVVNGKRYIDRDYTAYAHYGYAVTLKMRLPVRLDDGTQLRSYTENQSATETDASGVGGADGASMRYYLRTGEEAGTWVKLDPETFEAVGEPITVSKEPSRAYTDQVVGYVYYDSRTANLSTGDLGGYNGNVKGYSYATELNGGVRGAVLGKSQIAPDRSTISSLWGIPYNSAPSAGLEGYRFIASFDTNDDETVLTGFSTDAGKDYFKRTKIENTDSYLYSVDSASFYDTPAHTLKAFRNPETREVSAYAYWTGTSFSDDDYDTSSLIVTRMQ